MVFHETLKAELAKFSLQPLISHKLFLVITTVLVCSLSTLMYIPFHYIEYKKCNQGLKFDKINFCCFIKDILREVGLLAFPHECLLVNATLLV